MTNGENSGRDRVTLRNPDYEQGPLSEPPLVFYLHPDPGDVNAGLFQGPDINRHRMWGSRMMSQLCHLSLWYDRDFATSVTMPDAAFGMYCLLVPRIARKR